MSRRLAQDYVGPVMAIDNFNYLVAFLVVAREQSFTRAAAQLGVSRPALSRTIGALEARLGIRLLTRTTRSVSLTEAGERLMESVGPRMEDISVQITALSEMREKPAGAIRITTTDYAADQILWPKLQPFLKEYPDISVELGINYGLTDIVAERYDLGVRLGDQIAQDMIAVRVAPDMRMCIVGSPEYLARKPAPATPQELAMHECVNLRLPTHGGLYAWELCKEGKDVRVKVGGQLTFNGIYHVLEAALDGFGLAYVPENLAQPHVEAGRLNWVLADWFPTFKGYHLYYPNRRQTSAALALLIDALRLPTASRCQAT